METIQILGYADGITGAKPSVSTAWNEDERKVYCAAYQRGESRRH